MALDRDRQGSRNKLKYDPSKRIFKLSKAMPERMVLPDDFGFVRGTKADDREPLDVLVLTDDPLFPGCLVDCNWSGLLKRSRKSLALALLVGVGLFSQAQPAFEVASIRVHSFGSDDRSGPLIAGNRFTRGGNLNQLVMYAWDLKVYQLSGGPDWVTHPSTGTDYYDISAIAEGSEPLTQSRARQLLQNLLADRFHLRIHREMKEMPVYALIVGKSGPKFRESAPDATSGIRASVTVATVTSTFKKSRMDDLVRLLSSAADRPVLDRTGLAGFYDFRMEFARDPAAAVGDSNASSIFTAVQEQLGLKLEPQRGSIEIMVIDHAERPSEN